MAIDPDLQPLLDAINAQLANHDQRVTALETSMVAMLASVSDLQAAVSDLQPEPEPVPEPEPTPEPEPQPGIAGLTIPAMYALGHADNPAAQPDAAATVHVLAAGETIALDGVDNVIVRASGIAAHVDVRNSSRVRIEGVEIDAELRTQGIYVADSSDITIVGCSVVQAGNGIHCANIDRLYLCGNDINFTEADPFKVMSCRNFWVVRNRGPREIVYKEGAHKDFCQLQGTSTDGVFAFNENLHFGQSLFAGDVHGPHLRLKIHDNIFWGTNVNQVDFLGNDCEVRNNIGMRRPLTDGREAVSALSVSGTGNIHAGNIGVNKEGRCANDASRFDVHYLPEFQDGHYIGQVLPDLMANIDAPLPAHFSCTIAGYGPDLSLFV